MLWMIKHIGNITENGTGAKQRAYIKEKITSLIYQYGVNVEKYLRSRRTPKTWINMDILYLPQSSYVSLILVEKWTLLLCHDTDFEKFMKNCGLAEVGSVRNFSNSCS